MLQTRYYKIKGPNHEWCILSFKCSYPSDTCNLLVRKFLRYSSDFTELAFAQFFEHELNVFATFRIGAFQAEVGSETHMKYTNLFTKSFVQRLSDVSRS